MTQRLEPQWPRWLDPVNYTRKNATNLLQPVENWSDCSELIINWNQTGTVCWVVRAVSVWCNRMISRILPQYNSYVAHKLTSTLRTVSTKIKKSTTASQTKQAIVQNAWALILEKAQSWIKELQCSTNNIAVHHMQTKQSRFRERDVFPRKLAHEQKQRDKHLLWVTRNMFETFGKAITCAQCTRPKARAHTHKITCGHTQLVKYWGGGEIIDKQRKNQQIIYQT